MGGLSKSGLARQSFFWQPLQVFRTSVGILGNLRRSKAQTGESIVAVSVAVGRGSTGNPRAATAVLAGFTPIVINPAAMSDPARNRNPAPSLWKWAMSQPTISAPTNPPSAPALLTSAIDSPTTF